MALKVGDLVFNVKANTAQLTTQLGQASGFLRGFALTAVSGIASSLVAATAAAGAFAVRVSAAAQTASVQFGVLLGSTEKARVMLNDLKAFAAASPLEFTDVQQGAKILLNYGFTARQVMPAIKALGDVSMGNAEKFNRLSLAFGQVAAKGRLMGQENLQLVESGFSPLLEISKRTGETMLQLSKRMEAGGISVKEVAIAFEDVTGKSGRFFNMTEQASKTLEGRFSSLKDAVAEFGRVTGAASVGPLTDMTERLTTLLDLAGKGAQIFRTGLNAAVQWFAITFAGSLAIAKENLGPLSDVAKVIEGIVGATKTAAAPTEKLSDTFANIAANTEKAAKEAEKFITATRKLTEEHATPFEKYRNTISELKDSFSRIDGISKETFGRGMKKAADDLKKAFEEMFGGDKIRKEIATPMEKFQERLAELARAAEAGAISWDTYGRSVAKAREEMDEAGKTSKKLRETSFSSPGAVRGTTEGAAAVQKAIEASIGLKNKNLEVEAKKHTKLLTEIEKAVRLKRPVDVKTVSIP